MAVSIVKTLPLELHRAIQEALILIEYRPSGRPVVIKPNIVGPRDRRTAVVTDPRLVEALIIYLKDYTDEITIAEGSAIGFDTQESFMVAGYHRLKELYGIHLLDLNRAPRIKMEWESGEIGIPECLTTHEYINVPKMKTHNQTFVTLAMKNQKGLLSTKDKRRFHKLGLHEPIAALAEVIRPDLTVMDATTCIEGNGPGRSGEIKTMNLLIAGQDMIEVDNVAIRIMGFVAGEVKHIPYRKVEVKGLRLEEVISPFNRPDAHFRKLNSYFWLDDASMCSGCVHRIGTAMRSLPKHPICAARFFLRASLRRIDIFGGNQLKKFPAKSRVLAIGDCSREIAEKRGYCFVPGCPPKVKDIIRSL
jgi:uncharacterized protein (DUF362 family)